MTKIAFNLLGNADWHAGYVYITNLLYALQIKEGNKAILSLLLHHDTTCVPEELQKLFDNTIVYPYYRRWSMIWFIDQGMKRLFRHDLLRDLLLKRHQIKTIAFGEAPLASKIPSLAWLPDFQHIHLAQMFSSKEISMRNHSFLHIAKISTKILLLSEYVKHDFLSFAPQYAHKARVLSPVSFVPAIVYESDPQSITSFYNLPAKFIYLPNQFWKHKNHTAVFQALKILKTKKIEIFLVCSGALFDYRHPGYLSEILQDISCLKLRNQIAILGLIPREHVFQLMRQSVCVLNPSLFEGYGMTIDEARSLGKRVLLSDLPVHHEQNPPLAVFFDPHDYEDLANKIEMLWSAESPGPDPDLEKKARQELKYRLNDFAESFMSIVREVSF